VTPFFSNKINLSHNHSEKKESLLEALEDFENWNEPSTAKERPTIVWTELRHHHTLVEQVWQLASTQ
jgi:hypothetical protein